MKTVLGFPQNWKLVSQLGGGFLPAEVCVISADSQKKLICQLKARTQLTTNHPCTQYQPRKVLWSDVVWTVGLRKSLV